MFVPKALVELFQIGRATVDELKINLAIEQAKNQILERELTAVKMTSDWLRMQFNQIQFERTALIEKIYGIKLPAPEIVRTPVVGQSTQQDEFSFDDIGDTEARKLGYATYDDKN